MIKTYWKKLTELLIVVLLSGLSFNIMAADYTIDPTHSFVEFRIKHLGYSWLYGRFNTVEGTFSHDSDKPMNNRIDIEINTASIDTNHAERDKHLRGGDFLNAKKFPQAVFKATGYSGSVDKGKLVGDLTLHGVTKPISIELTKIGEGDDPWGNYRAGFAGTILLTPSEFGIDYDLGPASATLEMRLGVEGIRN